MFIISILTTINSTVPTIERVACTSVVTSLVAQLVCVSSVTVSTTKVGGKTNKAH